MVLACLLFIKRMSEETHVDSWTYVDDDTPDVDEHLQKLPLQIRVYEITGPCSLVLQMRSNTSL